MATIRDVIVRGAFDPAGMRAGIERAAAMFEGLSDDLKTSVNAQIGAFEQLSKTVTVTSAKTAQAFRDEGDALARNLAGLGATEQELNRIGAAIAGVERRSGAALALATSQKEVRTLSSLLSGLHGSAAIGLGELARGVGKVAQAGQVGAFAMREFTGAAFRLGEFLGPAGPLLPVIGLLGFALFEIFHGAAAEAEKMRKKFEEELQKMVEATDSVGLQKKFRELEIGKPDVTLPNLGLSDFGNFFKGGIRDLEARIQDDKVALKAALDQHAYYAANQLQLALLRENAQLADMIKNRERVRAMILNPPQIPELMRPITGAAGQVTVQAKTPLAQSLDDLKRWQEAIRDTASQGSALAQLFNTQLHQPMEKHVDAWIRLSHHVETVGDRQAAIGDIVIALESRYVKLHKDLEALTDPLDKQIDQFTTIKKAIDDIEKTDWFKIMARPLPSVRLMGDLSIPRNIRPTALPQPSVGDIGFVAKLRVQLSTLGDSLKANITTALTAAMGPVAILMRALEPGLRVLGTLFDRLAVPIAMVAQVLAASLMPILRVLFPILRDFGIVVSFLGEVIARIAAAVAQAIGGLVKAIGNVIAHLPFLGSVGRAIANLGQSILNYAEGEKQAAEEFMRTRHELQGMTWEGTAAALERLQGAAGGASDALTNIPNTFKVQRAIFLATQPANASNVVGGASGMTATNYFAPGAIIIIGSDKTGAQLLDEVSAAARQRSMARTGTTADAANVIA